MLLTHTTHPSTRPPPSPTPYGRSQYKKEKITQPLTLDKCDLPQGFTFINIFTKYVPDEPVEGNSTLSPVMARRRASDKPLTEAMFTEFSHLPPNMLLYTPQLVVNVKYIQRMMYSDLA